MFSPRLAACTRVAVVQGGGRCTRGSGDRGRGREGYTGTQPGPVPVPIFSHIPEAGPYPRPNEGNSKVFDEVS